MMSLRLTLRARARASLRAVLLASLPLGLSACGNSGSPYMRPAAAAPIAAREGEAVVVFVREGTACDVGGFVRIVEGDGAYLGDTEADTRFAVGLPAGEHTFVAWDAMYPLPPRYDPWMNWTGVAKATLAPGRVYYVRVRTSTAGAGQRCAGSGGVALLTMAGRTARGDDIPGLLESTTLRAPDRARGNAALLERHAVVERYLRQARERWAGFTAHEREERTIVPGDGYDR